MAAQVQAPAAGIGSRAAAQAEAQRFLASRDRANAIQPANQTLVSRAGIQPRRNTPWSAQTIGNLSAAWTPLGPATVTTSLYGAVTGRITSIALDPNDLTGNTVWLGTAGGGVWKSTNAAGNAGAVTFAPLTDDLPAFALNAGASAIPSLSIGAVAVQPMPNPVVLAGTGDPNVATDSYYGSGILRSADGGQTWTLAQGSQDGANGTHPFAGMASAGIAWSTASTSTVVAAFSTSSEGLAVGATTGDAVPGLYYSTDAGVTWHMATVTDGSDTVQQPTITGSGSVGAPATSVLWNARRSMFFAAIQAHGYYSSMDGHTWTRLPNQPGTGLTSANCPAGVGGQGRATCPMLRGTLAVQPSTGDLYALTVDANDNDQGLWQDLCNAGSNGSCANAAPTFANRIDAGALEVGQGVQNASTQTLQGGYNLSLAALPGTGGGTVLFAGVFDLYRCTLSAGASSCSFRNTTNAGNGCNASSLVAPAQHALAGQALGSGGPLLFLGNDGGLWRSTDGVAQTGQACASSDAAHFQNLNGAIGAGGSLAEIVGFAQDPSQAGTLIAGMGGMGTAASSNGTGTAAWPQLSEGEGGNALIDPVAPANWYASIGAGVNLKGCTQGVACGAADFTGSADIGANQTGADAALLDAPLLLDQQNTSNLLTATCRVWRGSAQAGASWGASNALSPALDGRVTPCTSSSALIRSLAAGGPGFSNGTVAHTGSEVIYAATAGALDGGGTVPGHIFVTKAAQAASSSTPWTDITGSPVTNVTYSFNSPHYDVSSVVVDPHDGTGATVYATVMGFGATSHVYRSTDFGAHWVTVDANLPSVPANALVVDPNDANTVYVALDSGVYVTQAISTCTTQNCWSSLGSALPNAPVTQLQAAVNLPTGDGRVGMLRASTYGRGLWQTPLVTAHSAVQPQLSASPGSLSFLPQPVATQSDALTVTLLSYGNVPASVTSVVLTGDFTETDTCTGNSIAVGSNCTVAVRFAPTATGGRSGLLTIYANVPGGQVTVALSGTGSAPASVVLTPLQVKFGATTVNQTAAAQIVTISNTGGNTATLQMPTITGDFSIAANTCGTALPSQTGCSLSILFKPTASGTRTGVLTVIDSAGIQTAQLSGTGQSPATDTLSPLTLSFAAQPTGSTSAVQQVTLTNAGDVPLTLISAVIASGDFQATNACGTSLTAHASCAVNVSFVPTALGVRTGQLQVTDQFRTQTVALTGAGVAPAGVSLSPSALNFGSIGVGLTSPVVGVVLSNNGGVPLLLASTAITGDFQVASSNCASILQSAGSCTLNLLFAPKQPGPRSGSLTITDNAAGGSQTVTLAGMGIDFGLAVDGPVSQTVNSGAIAAYPLLLTSASGLTGAVTFTCAGAPTNTICTVNPSPAQLGSGSSHISVTLQTGLATSAHLGATPQLDRARIFLCCLPGALLFLTVKRRGRTLRAVSLAALIVACCTLVGGCGSSRLIPLGGTGGSGTGDGSGGSVPTAPGSYAITVTGTSTGVSHAVQLTLVVQ